MTTAILNMILSQFFSSVGAWCMRPALSIDWHTLLEGDLVAHFVVHPNYQEDETMHRETLENLDRCLETKKHKHVVLTMVGLEGPNTQDSQAFHGGDWLHGHLSSCWCCWKGGRQVHSIPSGPSDNSGRKMETNFTIATSTECSSLSAMLTHPGILSSFESQRFNEDRARLSRVTARRRL